MTGPLVVALINCVVVLWWLLGKHPELTDSDSRIRTLVMRGGLIAILVCLGVLVFMLVKLVDRLEAQLVPESPRRRRILDVEDMPPARVLSAEELS